MDNSILSLQTHYCQIVHNDIALFIHTLRNIPVRGHTDTAVEAPPIQATNSGYDYMYIIVVPPQDGYTIQLVTVAQEANQSITSEVARGKMETLHLKCIKFTHECLYSTDYAHLDSTRCPFR